MKRINKKAAVILFTALFTASIFAQESELAEENTQETIEEVIQEASEAIAEEIVEKAVEESSVISSKYGDVLQHSDKTFIQKIIGSQRYIAYDGCSLFTGTLGTSITEKFGEVCVNTNKNMVGFGAPYLASYYHVNFDDSSAEQLKKAAGQYLEDFQNKRLKRKNNKSYRAYGKNKAYVEWGSFKANLPYGGTTNVYFGYKFVKDSPYFIIRVDKTLDEKNNLDINESLVTSYYFTKAQLQDLVEKITDPEVYTFLHMSKIVNEKSKEVETSGDEY